MPGEELPSFESNNMYVGFVLVRLTILVQKKSSLLTEPAKNKKRSFGHLAFASALSVNLVGAQVSMEDLC